MWWTTPPVNLTSNPVSAVKFFLTDMNGIICSLGVQAAPTPAVVGIQRCGMIPLPQNQIPKRLGSGRPVAYAVPLVFSMAFRRGRPTVTNAPPAIPRMTARRESGLRGMQNAMADLLIFRRQDVHEPHL